ncbi:hypothetical protein VII00023_02394 [Vibrio ichthyoenteri ATCC 700023]|uniref:Uncharacterized protein n=1 Tax=Vibrio ichthyoenteri ATCC 700023 TaxID=870968 RepID=F9S7C0_9VIBR|nr:hypothetical protein VII00023_02394 [Vibrio ichthyoenteri ATCC 700023]
MVTNISGINVRGGSDDSRAQKVAFVDINSGMENCAFLQKITANCVQ